MAEEKQEQPTAEEAENRPGAEQETVSGNEGAALSGSPDQAGAVRGTSNESPQLPPSAQAAAAKAHALLEHLKDVATQVQADVERVVPASMIDAAKSEVAALIRAAL